MSSQPSQVSKSALEALTAARDLIADPKRWTQGAQARDKYGHRVKPNHPSAVKWCATGALRQVSGLDLCLASPHQEFLHEASIDTHHTFPIAVNDDPTRTRRQAHARVLAMYDHAISTLELHGGNR